MKNLPVALWVVLMTHRCMDIDNRTWHEVPREHGPRPCPRSNHSMCRADQFLVSCMREMPHLHAIHHHLLLQHRVLVLLAKPYAQLSHDYLHTRARITTCLCPGCSWWRVGVRLPP